MVGVLIGMKLRVLRNSLRGATAASFVIGGFVGLAAAVATALRNPPARPPRQSAQRRCVLGQTEKASAASHLQKWKSPGALGNGAFVCFGGTGGIRTLDEALHPILP